MKNILKCLFLFVLSCNSLSVSYSYELKNDPMAIILIERENPIADMQEIQCLADNIYFEARGESERGWEAVASVTKNRVDHKSFPDSYCKVVKQKQKGVCQFSWYCNKELSRKQNHRKTALYQAIVYFSAGFYLDSEKASRDITKGAIYYHHKDLSKERLGVAGLSKPLVIGNHIFYREKI